MRWLPIFPPGAQPGNHRASFTGGVFIILAGYVYDRFSLVTSVTIPRNHVTTINRDLPNGNPLSIVNYLGHTNTMVYDSRGLVTKMTSPNGLVTYLHHDLF